MTSSRRPGGARLLGVLALMLAAPTAAHAESPPWAGSSVSLRNVVSAYELDKSNSQTWNPYYGLGLTISPRWRFGDVAYVSGALSMSREITQSDATTREGEIWLGDVSLTGGTSGLTLPVIGSRVGASLTAVFPSSKPSQSDTLQLGLRPALSLSHRFPVLAGLSVSYSGSLRFNMHRYTTGGQLDAPRIATCQGIECAELRHDGVRNVRWQHGHRLGLALGIIEGLSLSAGAGVYVSHLYDGVAAEDASVVPVEPINSRYAASYDAELTVGPFAGLSFGLGLSTFGPQRAPDQSIYDPFYNRFTQAYLDVRLDVAGLLSSDEEG